MNFAQFDKTHFPRINVYYRENIKDYNDYKHFENDWLSCYEQKKNFYFIFDTCKVGLINPIYGYHLSNFISKLKNLKKQYLTFSIIQVNNWYVKQMLFWVFTMQKPVAPVYIIEKNIDIELLIQDIHNQKIVKDDNIYIVYP